MRQRGTPEHDIEIVREALRLEEEAVARYVKHGSATADPRLFAYWESLRRNEADHRDALVAWLQQHGQPVAGEPS